MKSILIVIFAICTFVSTALAADEERFEYAIAWHVTPPTFNTTYWREKPEETCKVVPSLSSPANPMYDPGEYTHFEMEGSNEATCHDANGETADINYSCFRRDRLDPTPSWVRVSPGSSNCNLAAMCEANPATPPAEQSEAPPSSQQKTFSSFNSTIASDLDVRKGYVPGANTLTEVDWVAPNEPRFKLTRNYRSDDEHFRSSRYGYEFSHAGIWRQNFSDLVNGISVYDPETGSTASGVSVAFSNGSRLKFGRKPDYAPMGIDRGYDLEPGRRGALYLTDSNRIVRTFNYIRGVRLTKIEWPDGYTIDISLSGFNVQTVTDNKGNRFSYHWSDTLIPGETRMLLSSVDVERLDGEGVFQKEIEITYGYQANPLAENRPLLTSVSRKIGDAEVEILAEYTYLAGSFPPALASHSRSG